MPTENSFWDRWWGRLVSPKVDEEELERCYRQVQQQLPIPVFWMLGKTQSGKTSLIRGLTRNSRAEIGNGIRPCTRTAQEYPFPSAEDCLLRFLDTRGLGEVAYDPAEDIALFQDQAHLLVVVMKAMDHAQQAVMATVQQIHAARPQWPLLVVQTCLHEGYGAALRDHVVPYPFPTVSTGSTPETGEPAPMPPQVPADLARSLLAQRELFANAEIPATFVPVDFTLPEDGFTPEDYGLEALWTAIEEALPLGLRGVLEQVDQLRDELHDLHFRTARPHILSYSVAAGAAAGLPVPLIDVPLVLGIQAKMFQTIASIYRQEMNSRIMGEVFSALGMSTVGRLGGRELLKIIPGYGSAVSALYAGACTYALGASLCVYFSRRKRGTVPDPAEFRRIYDAQFQEGRERLKTYLAALRKGAATEGASTP